MSDIREVLSSIGYDLKDFGKSFRTRPLYRESDNDTVLAIDKNTGLWFDFKTRQSGNLEQLIQLTLKLDSIAAARAMLPDLPINTEVKEKPLADAVRKYDKSVLMKLQKDHSYWVARGVSERTLNLFKGGVAPKDGKMSYRYTFPIFNDSEEILGFSGRDILPYANSERIRWKHLGDKQQWCYPTFLNKSHILGSKSVILVESIGDMLALWENDIKNVIVTFGLYANTSILKFLIKSDVEKIYIAFNNDEKDESAGNIAAEDAKNKLLDFFDEPQLTIAIPESKDFGIMSPEQILSWKTHYLH